MRGNFQERKMLVRKLWWIGTEQNSNVSTPCRSEKQEMNCFRVLPKQTVVFLTLSQEVLLVIHQVKLFLLSQK